MSPLVAAAVNVTPARATPRALVLAIGVCSRAAAGRVGGRWGSYAVRGTTGAGAVEEG
jgi:hypothetical protein